MSLGKCPCCLEPIQYDRFIGNNYYCRCGWEYEGVRGQASQLEIVTILSLLILGLGFILLKPNFQKLNVNNITQVAASEIQSSSHQDQPSNKDRQRY